MAWSYCIEIGRPYKRKSDGEGGNFLFFPIRITPLFPGGRDNYGYIRVPDDRNRIRLRPCADIPKYFISIIQTKALLYVIVQRAYIYIKKKKWKQ